MRSDPRYTFPGEPRRPPVALWIGLVAVLAVIFAWIGWPSKTPDQPRVNALPTKSKRTVKIPAASLPKLHPPVPTNTPAPPPPSRVIYELLGTSAPPRFATNFPGTGTLAATNSGPHPVRGGFELQLALDRLALSPGSLDGAVGSRTRNALRAFQEKEKVKISGELDPATRRRLLITDPIYTNYVVGSNDLTRLLPLGKTWMAKWHQPRLDYETLLELVAERGHSHPDLIRQLNPGVDWTNVTAGATLRIPNIPRAPVPEKAAFARILLADRALRAYDDKTNLLLHFPCSIARNVDKRPVGELHVAVIVQGPNYTFDPANFPNSAEARELKTRLVLPAGPNNPVGTVWIGLDKPGYGIHGTPHPEQVGQAESLGCFRLANWNAEYLLQLVWVRMPVYVEP